MTLSVKQNVSRFDTLFNTSSRQNIIKIILGHFYHDFNNLCSLLKLLSHRMFLSNVLLRIIVYYEKRCRSDVQIKIYQEWTGANCYR
jgi:hypothetical protein